MRRVLADLFERWTAGKRSLGGYVFAVIARPCSWLYRLLLSIGPRRTVTRRALDHSRLIVISSPLVGGVGKTPLTILLVNSLQDRQERVAVVTMGYGRARAARASFSTASLPNTTDVGDEGMEIGLFTRAEVHTGPDPADVIDELDGTESFNWIVFDDGVSRRWDGEKRIVVLSADALENHVRYLPFGRWRATPSMIALARFVAITSNSPPHDPASHTARLRSWGYEGPVGWFTQGASGLARWDASGMADVPTAPRDPALLFCGIARPHRFREAAAAMGVKIAGFVTYPDHHGYSAADCARLDRLRGECGATWFLTTVKDVVRTPSDWPVTTPLLYLRTSLNQVAGDDLIAALENEFAVAAPKPLTPAP